MLNWLMDKISEEGLSIDEHGSFEVISSSFWKRKFPLFKLHRVPPPNNFEEINKLKRKDHQLFKIEIDENNSEFKLYAVTPLTDQSEKSKNIKFETLVKEALEASKNYSNLSVETTYQTDAYIDGKGPIWFDFPIVGFFTDVENRKIILLETA